jgi:Ala-tRNA(Pro) deacylase
VVSKNIVLHAKGEFYVVVTTAAKDIKARVFKKEFGTKAIRFATPEELSEHTGCLPGAVPPFGYVRPDIPIYFDKDILGAEFFMFNPGIHNRSIRVKPDDMLKVYRAVGNPVKIFEIGDAGIAVETVVKHAAPDPYRHKKTGGPS